MNFPPVLFLNQDFSTLFTNNYSNRNSSSLIQYQILCKKLIKFENKEQNFQANVINWIKSLEIQQLIKYFSFKNKWFTDILHEMILISDSKQDLKYSFIEASNTETEQKEPQNTKFLSYLNFLFSQKECPRFFDYFIINDDGLVSLSRNKTPEEKLKKKFIDSIRYISLSSNDNTNIPNHIYNGYNSNNNNNNSNINNTNDKKEEIIYCEYNNVITLSYDYLLNIDKLLQTFSEISNKSCFKYPIEIDSKLCKSGKKYYYNFKLPKWLGEKFTLPELLCAYFEQCILINYQYYLLYNQELPLLYYNKLDELLENIYKLKEFIFNSKDSINMMENIKPEDIKKIINENQYIKKLINDKKSIDDDIRNNYIGKISYSKKHTIKTIINNTLSYLGNMFLNDKLNFIISITFIKDSVIYTTEDFVKKIVYDMVNNYWKNKMAEDLLQDLDNNNDKDNDNKKRKKKKKKKKEGKIEYKNKEIEDNTDNNNTYNNIEENNDTNINLENDNNKKNDNDKENDNNIEKNINNNIENNINNNIEDDKINDENQNENNKKELKEEKDDNIIEHKEKESENNINEIKINDNNMNNDIKNEEMDCNDEKKNIEKEEENNIKEEQNKNENNIEEEESVNHKKKKEKNFFLYPTVKDKKKKNKPKKKDKNQNTNSNTKKETQSQIQNTNKNPNVNAEEIKKENEILSNKEKIEKTETDDKIEIIVESSNYIKNYTDENKEKEKFKKNKNGYEHINSKQKNKFNMGMKLKNMIKDNENLIIPKNFLPHDNSYNKLNYKNQISLSFQAKTEENLENSNSNNSSTTEGSSIQSTININYIAGSNLPRFTSFNFQSKKKNKNYRNKQNNNINVNITPNPYSFISNNIFEFTKEIIDNTIKVNNNKRILEKVREKYIKKIYEIINIFLFNEKINFLCSFYGSSISTLSIENSDIDIMVKLKENKNENDYLNKIMNLLVNHLKNNNINYISNIIPIFSASVPVIKIECNLYNDESFSNEVNTLMKNYDLSYNDITKLYFDITFFEVENEQNKIPSELMVDYIKESIMIYPQIIDIMYIMKRFLFNKKLNKSYQGGISSYSLFLLTLAFVKYYKNSREIPIGSLLIEFLNHYANFNFYDNVIQPNQDDNIYTLIENGPGVNKYNLNIIDPITGLNVSKSTFKIEQIQKVFREGLDIILTNLYMINNGIIDNKNNKKILESFLAK